MSLKRAKEQLRHETNPTVINRLNRGKLRCSLCPPNKGENTKCYKKHGVKKPKKKDHRK